ncbi:hypothetical protein V8C35DRAFT_269980 [Trichoderma chlorosporum]
MCLLWYFSMCPLVPGWHPLIHCRIAVISCGDLQLVATRNRRTVSSSNRRCHLPGALSWRCLSRPRDGAQEYEQPGVRGRVLQGSRPPPRLLFPARLPHLERLSDGGFAFACTWIVAHGIMGGLAREDRKRAWTRQARSGLGLRRLRAWMDNWESAPVCGWALRHGRPKGTAIPTWSGIQRFQVETA